MSQPTDSTRAAWNHLWHYLGRHAARWALALAELTLANIFLLIGILLSDPLIKLAQSINQPPAAQAAALRGALVPGWLGVTASAESINQAVLLQGIWIIIGATVVSVLASQVLFYLSYAQIAGLGQQMAVDIRADYYAHVVRQGPGFYRRRAVGELLTIGLSDVEAVGTFFSQDVPLLLNVSLQLVMTAGLMFWRQPTLALGSVVFAVVLYVVSTYVLVPRIGRRNKQYGQQYAAASAQLNENLVGARDIQIFRQEARTIREWRARLQDMAATLTRAVQLNFLNSTLAFATSIFGVTFIYGLGAHGILSGVLDAALLIAFARLFDQFINAIRNAGPLQLKLQATLIAAGRVFDVMSTPPDIQERPGAIDPGLLTGHIRFENVTFAYQPDDPLAWRVRDVNLEILPGEKVAFVGGSGTGKTTLLNLVARFYDVTEGRVTIDGYDVRDLKLDALRRNFGLVAQNVILFQGTLADNIRFARPDAGMDAVQAAAEVGYVTEFVDKLDRGWDTMLGEFGQGLSGGQKQRVSIARAALLDPTILLLDEPTSALDPQTENVVIEALDRLSRGRTTLIVSHRLNTIVNADKIVVLGTDENGHGVVRAVGQHDQLLEASPEYVQLWGKYRRKAILMPIGPLYDTTAALPTVIGLAHAHDAPVHLLDFGPLDTDKAEDRRFGVTVVRGAHSDPRVINLLHAKRVNDILKALHAEGIPADTLSPTRRDVSWVEATIEALKQTQSTHIIAVDNVMVPMDKLREGIRQIERKAAVEYILVNPIAEVG
ncbi:MAG: ABC transporter ATP-binding protein [Anaerolineales bacterium]|nr:ABC transporter ATP-binding protein [Anaerolineales bacterium]